MNREDLKNPEIFDVVSMGTDWALYRNKKTDDYVLLDLMTEYFIWIEDEDLEEVRELIEIAYQNTEDERKVNNKVVN